MIQKEHLFCLDRGSLTTKLIQHGLVVNFAYGQSKELIYDYEEIESTLCAMVHRLPLIDTEHLRQIHYQGELYSENNALINDVRRHVQQQQLSEDRRRQYRSQLERADENTLLQYLGSLDFIFTYIRSRHYRSSVSTVALFVQQYIRSKSFLERNPLLEPPYVNLELQHILDFYELVEEIAFDRIFRFYIDDKLNDKAVAQDQRKQLQNRFLRSITDNPQLARSLRELSPWIATLKRFMVRILQDQVHLDTPIEIYLKRTDLWSSRFSEEEIDTIELDQSILVGHARIILVGLEHRLDESNMNDGESETAQSDLQNKKKEQKAAKSFKVVPSQTPGKARPRNRDSWKRNLRFYCPFYFNDLKAVNILMTVTL